MWRLKIIIICVRLILQIENASGQFANTTLLGEDLDGFNYITKTKLNKDNNTRIVGGKPINIRLVPWQVALYNDGYFICGGSIISPDWVVTVVALLFEPVHHILIVAAKYAGLVLLLYMPATVLAPEVEILP